MEIKATCQFDFESVKALTYLMMFNKGNPKKRMISLNIVSSVLFAIIIFEIIVFGIDLPLVLGAIATIMILVWNAYMWFLYPKVRYNALGKMKGVQNEYIFTDEKIFVTTRGAEYNGQAEIEYTLLVKVYETSKHFFLYQTKNHVFIINKSTVEGGTDEDIRNKLTANIKGKYIICKY